LEEIGSLYICMGEEVDEKKEHRYVITMIDDDGENVLYSEVPEIEPYTTDLGITVTQYNIYLGKKLEELGARVLGDVYDEAEDRTIRVYVVEVVA